MLRTTIIATTLVMLATSGSARGLEDVNNQADINHPGIHGKVGDGTNANPNGQTNDGGGIHGIGNVPGQSGNSPSQGAPGFADQLGNVHGGIGDVNPNVAD